MGMYMSDAERMRFPSWKEVVAANEKYRMCCVRKFEDEQKATKLQADIEVLERRPSLSNSELAQLTKSRCELKRTRDRLSAQKLTGGSIGEGGLEEQVRKKMKEFINACTARNPNKITLCVKTCAQLLASEGIKLRYPTIFKAEVVIEDTEDGAVWELYRDLQTSPEHGAGGPSQTGSGLSKLDRGEDGADQNGSSESEIALLFSGMYDERQEEPPSFMHAMNQMYEEFGVYAERQRALQQEEENRSVKNCSYGDEFGEQYGEYQELIDDWLREFPEDQTS